MAREPQNLQQFLERAAAAVNHRHRVSLGRVVESVGQRAFGPLLLLVGLVLFSPLSAIPGLPTLMSLLVLLVALQLLLGRRRFWLPRWLLRRSLKRDRLLAALRWLERPAHFIDRYTRRRLAWLVRGLGTYLIALACLAVAIVIPLLELVPMSATIAGLALTAFGLGLVAEDGLLALLALAVLAAGFCLLAARLF